MLSFDDDFAAAPAPPKAAAAHAGDHPRPGRRAASAAASSRASPCTTSTSRRRRCRTASAACALEDKRVINGAGRRQPARAVQVQVGVGQVPRRLRQPLDAARDQHAARHRAVEEPQRPDRRRAADRQAQPGLLRHRRLARRQQHRARHVSPHHRARVPPVPAAPGVRGGDPHARLPVHRREPRPRRGGDLQRVPRDQVDPRQGRVPDPVHQRADRPDLQDRHAGDRPGAPEEPDRLLLHHGRPVLLRRLRADPGDGPPEQDDRRVRAVPVHPARRVDALQFRHRPRQHDQDGEPAPVDDRVPRRDRAS